MRKLSSWYCLAIKHHMDALAARQLLALDYQVFSPQFLHRPKRGPDQLRPLFPGYIFTSWHCRQSWHPIMGLLGIKGFLTPGLPHALPLGVIDRLARECDAQSILQPDTEMQVLSGLWVGQYGLVQSSDADRVQLLLMLLDQKILVSFNRHELRSA